MIRHACLLSLLCVMSRADLAGVAPARAGEIWASHSLDGGLP
jgi:hypothetical protein